MFHILIAEDVPEALDNLRALLSDEFSDSQVDVAENVQEAVECIQKAVEQQWSYDCAVLDLKLPVRKGENTEVDYTICEKIRKTMPQASVLHITGYADDSDVLQHLILTHVGSENDQCDFVPKQEDWAKTVIKKIRMRRYSPPVEEHLNALFGPPRRERFNNGEERIFHQGSMTHELAALQREIEHHWDALQEALKERIKELFHVEEKEKKVTVRILWDASGQKRRGKG